MNREELEARQRRGQSVRAAVYLRKSRAEEHMSLDETLSRHAAALADYAERWGFQVVETYKEVVSGESLFSRPQMLRLMEAVSAGEYEAVLCMDMQRLGRGGMYDQGFILDAFKMTSTLIATPERIYDLSNEMDEEAAEMQTFLSRSEYRMITKRLHRGTMQSVEHGAYMANAPFGYRKVRIGKLPTLEIVPEEAECVREIFRRYAAGDGCTKIERAINAMGFHGRRGSHFNRNTIRLILDNPVYIGKIRWNKTSTVSSGIGADRKKKVVYNAPDQMKLYDGRHPAIIDGALWDAVQSRRRDRYFYVDNKHTASPLAGLVRCSKCGRLMNMQGRNKGVPYLLCPTKGCCAGAKFSYVESAILRSLADLADSLEIQVQQAGVPDTSLLESSREKLLSQLQKLEQRRSRLYSLLEDGTYSRPLFSERMQVLLRDEDAAREGLSVLEEEIARLSSRNQEKQARQLRTVLEAYESADVSGRKALLYSVVKEIRYTKEKKTKPADFALSIELLDFF